MEPKGLKLLKGPKRSYEFMMVELDNCSERNNCDICSYVKECDKNFQRRVEEWKLRRERTAVALPRQPLIKKYANWIPVLSRTAIRSTIRERYVYP